MSTNGTSKYKVYYIESWLINLFCEESDQIKNYIFGWANGKMNTSIFSRWILKNKMKEYLLKNDQ